MLEISIFLYIYISRYKAVGKSWRQTGVKRIVLALDHLLGPLLFFTDLLQMGRSWVDNPTFCCCFAALWLNRTFESMEENDAVKSKKRKLQENGRQTSILSFRLSFWLVHGQSSFLVGHSRPLFHDSPGGLAKTCWPFLYKSAPYVIPSKPDSLSFF